MQHSLREYLSHIDEAFSDLIHGEGFHPDLFLVPGIPRIRPMLLLLSACAAQRVQALNKEDVKHIALSVEMCAAAIIVHDAALGAQGGLRRRVARKLLGKVKMLAGNQLLLRAINLMTQVSGSEHLIELISVFEDVVAAQKSAQHWGCDIPNPDILLEHHSEHHTQLFAFVCRAGARIAGAEQQSTLALGRYGNHFGMAWVIAEDLFWWLDSQEKGVTFLMAHASQKEPPYLLSLQNTDRDIVQLWQKLCRHNEQQTAIQLYHKATQKNAIHHAIQTVVEYCLKAQHAVQSLNATPHRDALIEMSKHLHQNLRKRNQQFWIDYGQL